MNGSAVLEEVRSMHTSVAGVFSSSSSSSSSSYASTATAVVSDTTVSEILHPQEKRIQETRGEKDSEEQEEEDNDNVQWEEGED